jgi:hypothetical protein
MSLGKVGYLDLFKNGDAKIRLRVLTGCGLQAMQQRSSILPLWPSTLQSQGCWLIYPSLLLPVSGINFIFYYGTTFFRRTGISNPFIITVITNVVNVCSTIPGILIVDKAGRRTLLLYGAAGQFSSLPSLRMLTFQADETLLLQSCASASSLSPSSALPLGRLARSKPAPSTCPLSESSSPSCTLCLPLIPFPYCALRTSTHGNPLPAPASFLSSAASTSPPSPPLGVLLPGSLPESSSLSPSEEKLCRSLSPRTGSGTSPSDTPPLTSSTLPLPVSTESRLPTLESKSSSSGGLAALVASCLPTSW